MSATYLLINLFAVSIPLAFSFHPRLLFWSQWRAWLPAILLPATPFILWDALFTQMGVWGFNASHLIGINLLGLPIEEWMFFFAIPYACLFTYASLKRLMPPFLTAQTAGRISLLLGLILVVFGIFNLSRLYTGVTFLTTGFFLLAFVWRSRLRFWEYFYATYLIIFALPFLLVNGLLTGWGLSEPVVWYNNLENLSRRVITIPIEDFVYGFLLLALNVTVFEWRLKNDANKSLR